MGFMVIDRFHLLRLVRDAMQYVRIKFRWGGAIAEENTLIKQAKEKKEKYYLEVFSNGDTLKELLSPSCAVFSIKRSQTEHSIKDEE